MTFSQIYNVGWWKSAKLTVSVLMSDVLMVAIMTGITNFVIFLSKRGAFSSARRRPVRKPTASRHIRQRRAGFRRFVTAAGSIHASVVHCVGSLQGLPLSQFTFIE